MFDMQKVKASFLQHRKKVVALACLVCFFLVFILSAALSSHSNHDHVPAAMCRATLGSDCNCEGPLIQTQAFILLHEHNHLHVDCSICAFLNKTINQVRHFSDAVAVVVQAEAGLFTIAILGFLLLISGTGTPVDLKTRTNN